MNKAIIIACRDSEFAMMLTEHFFRELDDSIKIHVITDYNFLLNYVNSSSVEEGMIILGKEYYVANLDISGFDMVVLLDENEKLIKVYNPHFITINPYLKLDVIYDYIMNQTPLRQVAEEKNKKNTKLIAVYSPIGGAGKTTVAYGLCMAFSKTYKKVLYINVNAVQDFGYLFDESAYMSQKLEWMIAKQSPDINKNLSGAVQNYGFDYLPPTKMSLTTLGIALKDYIYIVEELKRINKYDYIVVDMVSELSIETVQIIGKADQVICVGLQDRQSVYRLNQFLLNIDMEDEVRYLFLCNKYNPANMDYMNDALKEHHISGVKEYIEAVPDMETGNQMPASVMEALERISMHCI